MARAVTHTSRVEGARTGAHCWILWLLFLAWLLLPGVALAQEGRADSDEASQTQLEPSIPQAQMLMRRGFGKDDTEAILAHWHLLTARERGFSPAAVDKFLKDRKVKKGIRSMPRYWPKYLKARSKALKALSGSGDSPPAGLTAGLHRVWRDFLRQSPHAAHSLPDDGIAYRGIGWGRVSGLLSVVERAAESPEAHLRDLWNLRRQLGDLPARSARQAFWAKVRPRFEDHSPAAATLLLKLESAASGMCARCEDALDEGHLEVAWAMLAEIEVIDPIAGGDLRGALRTATLAQVDPEFTRSGDPGSASPLAQHVADKKDPIWKHRRWRLVGDAIVSGDKATGAQGVRCGVTLPPGLILTIEVRDVRDREVGVVFGNPANNRRLCLTVVNQDGDKILQYAMATDPRLFEVLSEADVLGSPGGPRIVSFQGEPFGARTRFDRSPWWSYRTTELPWRNRELALLAGYNPHWMANNSVRFRKLRFEVPEAWFRH